jgi:hypothetical protein
LGVQILLKINKVEFYFLLLDSQDIWSSLKQGFCLGQFSQVPTVDLENGRVIYGPVLLFSFINKNHMNYVKIIVYGKTYYNYTHGVLCYYYINKSWKEQSSRKIDCMSHFRYEQWWKLFLVIYFFVFFLHVRKQRLKLFLRILALVVCCLFYLFKVLLIGSSGC